MPASQRLVGLVVPLASDDLTRNIRHLQVVLLPLLLF